MASTTIQPKKSSLRIPGLAIALLVTAVTSTIALQITSSSELDSSAFAVAFGAITFLGLLPLIVRYHGGAYDLISPVTVFSLSFAFVFTWGTIFQASGDVPLARTGDLEGFPTGLFLAALGLAAFQLAYYAMPWRRRPLATKGSEKQRLPRFVFYFVGIIAFVWLARIYLSSVGAIGATQLSFSNRELAIWESTLKLIIQVFAIAIIPTGLYLYRLSRGTRFSVGPYTWLFIGSILIEFLFLLLVDRRSTFLANAAVFGAVFILLSERLPIRRLVTFMAIAIIVIIPFTFALRAALRDAPEVGTDNPLGASAGQVSNALGTTFDTYGLIASGAYGESQSRLNPLDFFVEVKEATETRGFMRGATILDAVEGLIPRFLWSNKPSQPTTDIRIQKFYGLRLVDTLTTPITELYANFGTTGIIGGMAVLGLFFRAVYQVSLLRYAATFRGILLYGPALALLVIFQEGGGVFHLTLDFLRFWTPFWILAFVVSARFSPAALPLEVEPGSTNSGSPGPVARAGG